MIPLWFDDTCVFGEGGDAAEMRDRDRQSLLC
jgi:hypothetical protein